MTLVICISWIENDTCLLFAFTQHRLLRDLISSLPVIIPYNIINETSNHLACVVLFNKGLSRPNNILHITSTPKSSRTFKKLDYTAGCLTTLFGFPAGYKMVLNLRVSMVIKNLIVIEAARVPYIAY